MDYQEIRKQAIIGMFADDSLMESFVLKGGNAISLVLGLSSRFSLDLDFSLEADFANAQDAGHRLNKALTDRFDSAGFTLFDFKFQPRPSKPVEGKPKTWGGYTVEFKLLEKNKYNELPTLEDRQRNALVVAPGDKKVFKIDISKHEYCKAKEQVKLDDYAVYVYTPAAIIIEKLRALCQQLPEYPLLGPKLRRPRPRDFYDIHTILKTKPVDLASPENVELIKNIFLAKEVPLAFLGKLQTQKEFHEQEFSAVRDTVQEATESFEVYFNSVIKLVDLLKPLWNE